MHEIGIEHTGASPSTCIKNSDEGHVSRRSPFEGFYDGKWWREEKFVYYTIMFCTP